MKIPRCQHLRVYGTQCGSPALHTKRFCYFHSRHQPKPAKYSAFDFSVLEDANAIQIALMQVIRAIADNHIECKRAGLLLYALEAPRSQSPESGPANRRPPVRPTRR